MPGNRKGRRLPPPQKPRRRRKASSWGRAHYALALTTLAVLLASIYDLIEGIRLLTGCPRWQAVSLAIGLDAMFIAVEAATISAVNAAEIRKYSAPLKSLTLAVSAGVNALALSHGQFDTAHAGSIAFGIFIPIAIYLASNILARMK